MKQGGAIDEDHFDHDGLYDQSGVLALLLNFPLTSHTNDREELFYEEDVHFQSAAYLLRNLRALIFPTLHDPSICKTGEGAVAECKSSAAAFLFPEKAYTQQLCG